VKEKNVTLLLLITNKTVLNHSHDQQFILLRSIYQNYLMFSLLLLLVLVAIFQNAQNRINFPAIRLPPQIYLELEDAVISFSIFLLSQTNKCIITNQRTELLKTLLVLHWIGLKAELQVSELISRTSQC
jgi:hypothetical protein